MFLSPCKWGEPISIQYANKHQSAFSMQTSTNQHSVCKQAPISIQHANKHQSAFSMQTSTNQHSVFKQAPISIQYANKHQSAFSMQTSTNQHSVCIQAPITNQHSVFKQAPISIQYSNKHQSAFSMQTSTNRHSVCKQAPISIPYANKVHRLDAFLNDESLWNTSQSSSSRLFLRNRWEIVWESTACYKVYLRVETWIILFALTTCLLKVWDARFIRNTLRHNYWGSSKRHLHLLIYQTCVEY